MADPLSKISIAEVKIIDCTKDYSDGLDRFYNEFDIEKNKPFRVQVEFVW